MQREIKKRAVLYGTVAFLLAIILGSLCFNLGYIPQNPPENPPNPPPQQSVFKTFASKEELQNFLTTSSRTYTPFLFAGPIDTTVGQVRTMIESSQGVYATVPKLSEATDYSETNIQVAGVDEADIVKTDGEYIYLISGTVVYILKAYPSEEAEVLAKIVFSDTSLAGIFVSDDSSKLAVLGCRYKFPLIEPWQYLGSIVIDVKTFLNVYDISNKSKPLFLTDFVMTGSYFNSRMIGNYVYFVVSQPAYIIYDTVILPKVYYSGGVKTVSASDILYYNASDNYFMYTTIIAFNVKNITEKPTNKTIMLGGTSTMYVSLNNLYITFPETFEKTAVYRVRIQNSTISPEAKGDVAGQTLNQFSMDEYHDHFRIATESWVNGTRRSNVYILNMNLTIVGSLENFAPINEILDSARFIGNRCYLTTSVRRQDPFFVVDVENVTNPKKLGYLEIPGFTSYLHPYDENHIIGVGRDENNSVKVSIFDVTNVSAPVQVDIHSVQGGWSDTPVLTEHKAFLFDKSKDLLAFPVSIYYYSETYWQWQGLYVFNITLSNGIVLRGNVTHQEDSVNYWDYNYWVKRALYIGNVLYTISDMKVKLNSLEDLALIKEIALN